MSFRAEANDPRSDVGLYRGYGMLNRIRQRDVDGAPRQRVIPVAVNQLDDAVDVDGRDAPRRALYAEDGPGGHLWMEGGFHGADLHALGISEHIISCDVHRHAAASGRALDDEAAEDLLFNRGYGMLRRPNPERHLTRSFRVDVPSLRVRVVVLVNLSGSPVDLIRAVLDVEHRAYLGRERPPEALPRAGKAEAGRRDLREPDGAANGPFTIETGYGISRSHNQPLHLTLGVPAHARPRDDVVLVGRRNVGVS